MIMNSYYKYSKGQVFEVRHEPDKYWLAIVIYSFDQLHLFKWLGSYGEFWHDSTISGQEEQEETLNKSWSRASATKRLFNPGYHMQFHLESQFTLEKPTTFLITPTCYNPADDPYGNITTVDDLLALDDDLLDSTNNKDLKNTTPTTDSNSIKEKLDNIITAVIEELEQVDSSSKPDELCKNVASSSHNKLHVPIIENAVGKHEVPTITPPPTQAPSEQITGLEKQSTDSDIVMKNDDSNEITSASKNLPDQIDKNEIVNQLGGLESLGIDFEERKRVLESQHGCALQRGWRISLDDWAKMNSREVTIKLYNKIISEENRNYEDIKDLCKIIQFQAQFEVYQSPLNGEIFRLTESRKKSNEFFDLSILNEDNRMQLEYDRIINENSMFIKIYFNHKCFTGPSLSKSKISSLPQYVGPGPLNLVIEEVVTKVIAVAYVPPRILNDLSSKTFTDLLTLRGLNNTSLMEFKAKYQKRVHREAIPICVSPTDLALYCECLCEHLKCCYNLFGPNLYDGDDCPGHCRALTKSNKFMKKAAYYREKARNGEFLKC